MADLAKDISDLKNEIEGYQVKLNNAKSLEQEKLYGELIKSRNDTLNRLLDEKQKSLPQGSNVFIGAPWTDQKFDIFGHGIGLAQLAVGVVGLGAVVAGGGLYAVKHHQRATSKFFNSLLATSENKLSKIRYSVLPRGQMTVGIEKEPIKRLNLRDAFKSVALVGDNRSGKTIFLSNTILNDLFPWWYRYVFPPRGLFLTGSQDSPTIKDWLKSQIATTEKDNPWAAVADLLSQRRQEQRVRLFLVKVFKTTLPSFLLPQPAIIVVDQAEELLRAYRADFLVGFYNLAKEGRDDDLFRLVLVINSENAVKALELMNGGNMFDVITAPKVSREAVEAQYGAAFAKIFDDCDSCIGVALDYVADKKRPKDMSAKEYAAVKREKYFSDNCLTKEITREEYNEAREHSKK
eukprot:gene11534-12911_t